jgi:hypothetical protein
MALKCVLIQSCRFSLVWDQILMWATALLSGLVLIQYWIEWTLSWRRWGQAVQWWEIISGQSFSWAASSNFISTWSLFVLVHSFLDSKYLTLQTKSVSFFMSLFTHTELAVVSADMYSRSGSEGALWAHVHPPTVVQATSEGESDL